MLEAALYPSPANPRMIETTRSGSLYGCRACERKLFGHCCQAHEMDMRDTLWSTHTEAGTRHGFGEHIQEFYGLCVCFGRAFITLMTYGLDGIDTQYP